GLHGCSPSAARSVDLFDDAMLMGFDDVGATVPVDVSVLAKRRSIPIDLFGECLDLHALRHPLAGPDLGADRAAGRAALALDGARLGVLADHFAITIAER